MASTSPDPASERSSHAETPKVSPAATDPEHDPVRARRAQVARWTLLANRVGYLVLALSVTLFVVAFAFGFSPLMATLVIASMVVAGVLLAPSIILGYAVKAAEREDREQGF